MTDLPEKAVTDLPEKAVTAKTLTLAMRRVSPVGMAVMQMAEMTSRLKAADPTMVPGPSSPASKFLPMISMTDSRISGADVPRASRDRLATVSFHTWMGGVGVGCGGWGRVWWVGFGGGLFWWWVVVGGVGVGVSQHSLRV